MDGTSLDILVNRPYKKHILKVMLSVVYRAVPRTCHARFTKERYYEGAVDLRAILWCSSSTVTISSNRIPKRNVVWILIIIFCRVSRLLVSCALLADSRYNSSYVILSLVIDGQQVFGSTVYPLMIPWLWDGQTLLLEQHYSCKLLAISA
jgi:hypothetical protein